jgi:hypothetical protein
MRRVNLGLIAYVFRDPATANRCGFFDLYRLKKARTFHCDSSEITFEPCPWTHRARVLLNRDFHSAAFVFQDDSERYFDCANQSLS